ncbi:MAG: hypothetical protein O7B81_14795 [Gammaproteobacteria bacterium]|nr:hypothetical protein [Gammaproteobacteria bacterium]
MKREHRVLLVTNEKETSDSVASALELNGHFADEGMCHNLQELAVRLGNAPAAGVLVDIDPQPDRILAELDPIITRFPDARFIVLSSAQANNLMLEAMQIGARHFLLKRLIESDLVSALDRLMFGGTAAKARGAVITVLGAGGGCGATTIAINLAHEIHLESKETVLAVDLDCWYGAVGTYLGLDGQYGIRDVLSDAGRIDPQLIDSTALEYSEGLRALISPAASRFSEAGPLEHEHLGSVVEACRTAFAYTVIDAPRISMDVAGGLVAAGTVTLIVFQLSVKDIRIAREMLAALSERGAHSDAIVLVANRFHKRHSQITIKEARSALGDRAIESVCNDYQSASRCINYGQLISKAAPRSSLRRDLRRLATKVCEVHSKPAVVA